ncbi:helix-hairpin-helix domain-containing protein [Dactylosporangium sp. NPDC049742]|uniref:helix-hairpin-helix domain-containing protein n=1 Tax=Dactylosporangium sp. NPDC049742 TaxID=3154737 RepID=UPI00341696AB
MPLPAADPTTTLSWRIRNSGWLLLPLLTLGCFSGAGLIVIGIRARRMGWWLPGAGYILAGCGTMIILPRTDPASSAGGLAFLAMLGVQAAAVVHSFWVNDGWLRWRAEQARYQNSAPAEAVEGRSMAVNVNTASARQLAGLPGFDAARAERVVAARDARQGFPRVADFAEAAGLTHDELRQLRYWLTV